LPFGEDLAREMAVMVPLLFADRFYCPRFREAIDLATGQPVWIRPVRLDSRDETAAWLRRCGALSGLWHPNLIALADFGTAGRHGHFEAWSCPPAPAAWKGPVEAAQSATLAVAGFLQSRALTPGRLRPIRLHPHHQPMMLPGRDTGLPAGGAPASEHRGRPAGAEAHGSAALAVPETDVCEWVRRLEDVLDSGVSGRPRAVSFRVADLRHRDVLVNLLARTARLRGYVPVTAAVPGGAHPLMANPRRWRALLAGRHVLVLDVGDSEDAGRIAAMTFLSLGLSSDRPHVWLALKGGVRASHTDQPAVVREEVAAYQTRAAPAADARQPEEMAVQSGLTWPGPPRIARASHAAVEAIASAVAGGRHAQAERLLREWLGRFARRREEAAGGEAALALGRLLLVRGRTAAAVRALEEARERFGRARLPEHAVEAAVFIGLAWTDAGRFESSEAALRAASLAAGKLPVPALEEFATLALARCLYWQGRVTEACDCLAQSSEERYAVRLSDRGGDASFRGEHSGTVCARERPRGVAPGGPRPGWSGESWVMGDIGLGVSRDCLASRVALATGDVERAGRSAAVARERAEQSGDAVGLAAACLAKATVYCVLGDVDATRKEVEIGLLASRRVHAPLRALRLRIVMARGLQSVGRDRDARGWLARLSRLDPARLPKVVSLPLERVIRGDERPRTGRSDGSLSGAAAAPAGSPASTALVEAVVDLLHLCQSSDNETVVLERVTATLRERVHAVSVACFGRLQDATFLISTGGLEHRAEDVARRAIDTGLVIAPTATMSGLEAAVPVRFAGACVGALALRFAADRPPDWPAMGDLVTAAAAVVGPCVRTAVDLRGLPASSPEAAVGEILGTSEAITLLRRAILRAAPAPFNVVIEGESGSGKELVARALHRLGPRRERPLCALNCAAITDELVEAELFGHARGAFTGAIAERKGLFEEADHGILVLDEVGELTARAQAKLLRAIQEGEVRRVGENFARPVDVRIVAATNRPLGEAVESGVFRRDLLYRLEVIKITVPPLRCRAEDVPLLAGHFWREAASRVGSRCTLSPATLSALARYDWPGNVRELQNVCAALAVSAGRRGSVGPDQLPALIGGHAAAQGVQRMADARRAFETGVVRAALARAAGHRAQAACELGLTRQGLAKLMARLGIE
jgi:DNA-binding NtrC family response regulator/tetratricopeptide (TPR) repeat protein